MSNLSKFDFKIPAIPEHVEISLSCFGTEERGDGDNADLVFTVNGGDGCMYDGILDVYLDDGSTVSFGEREITGFKLEVLGKCGAGEAFIASLAKLGKFLLSRKDVQDYLSRNE